MNDDLISKIEKVETRCVAQSPHAPPLDIRLRDVDIVFSALRPMLEGPDDMARQKAIQRIENKIMTNLTNYGNFTEAYACADILSRILKIRPARAYDQG